MSIQSVKEMFGISVGHVRESEPPRPTGPVTQKVSFLILNEHEYSVLFWGREVGYCGRKPNMVVNFLRDDVTKLCHQDKVDILAEIIKHVGSVKETPAIKAALRDAHEQIAND